MDVQQLSDAADAFSKKKAALKQAQEGLAVLLEMQKHADREDALGTFTLVVASSPPLSFRQPPPLDKLIASANIAPVLLHQILPIVITAQQGQVTELEMEMQELANLLVECATS